MAPGSNAMQAGQIISGTIHAGLLVLVSVGLLDKAPPAQTTLAVAEVTMISAEMLDAQASAPPMVLDEPTPQAAPDATTGETPPAPAVDAAPQASDLEAVEAAQPPDVAADLAPLRRPASVSNPVSMDSPVFDQPEAEAAPTMPQVTSQGNERNTMVTSLTPPPPRAAPRIDTSPAEAPPPAAEIAPEVQAEVAPDESAQTPVPEVEAEATAPAEATSQIQPEAVEDAPIAAETVELAALPVRRPRNMAAAAQAVEAAAEVSRRVAEEARLAAETAARDAAIANEASEIEAALRAADAANATSAQNATLTGAEIGFIAQGVSANWNKQLILEQPNFEQYIVRVSVALDRNGRIVGAVQPVEPMNPTGYFGVAFAAAERAIRLAEPIRLPTDRFPDGATLILNFDPVRGIGFN